MSASSWSLGNKQKGIKFGRTSVFPSRNRGMNFGVGKARWAKAGASLDLDFVNNRAYGVPAGTIASAVTMTRASAAYQDTVAGVWSSVANDVMRRTDRGLRCEETRTNSIRNNAGTGAVVGSPGTPPTNWEIANIAGLTRTIVGFGTENGIDYVDVRLNGISNSTFAIIAFESTATVVATPAQVWTQSNFISLRPGGTGLTNISAVQTIPRQVGGSNPGITVNATLDGVLRRQPAAAITLTAGATGVWPTLTLLFANGAAIDVTLRIGWPQLELGIGATSPIRTTAAAVTRQADKLELNTPATYVSLTEGMIYIKWQELIGVTGTARMLYSYRVNGNNRIDLYIATDGKLVFTVVVGGVAQCGLISTNAVTANNVYSAAVRWKANDFAMRTSNLGAQPGNDISGSVPAVAAAIFGIGNDGNAGNFANELIQEIATFKFAGNDNQLAALVA